MQRTKGEGMGSGGRSGFHGEEKEGMMSTRRAPLTVVEVDDVSRRPASSDEVSRAVATIEEAFGKTQPRSPIRELWFSPVWKDMILSLMMDPAVWEAIGDNLTVKAAVRRSVTAGKGGRSNDNMGGQSPSLNHFLHWVLETVEGLIKATQEIMKLLQSFSNIFMTHSTNGPFPSQQSGRRTTTTIPDEVQRLIMVSVIILYGAIIVLRLA